MRKILLVLSCAALFASCAKDPYKGISPELAGAVKANMALAAPENVPLLEIALEKTPEACKEGMAFLMAYMPEGDRDTLNADFLLTNVEYAYKARETFQWAAALPDSIFYNDVLPYASLNETREQWRPKFWDMFSPLALAATDVRAAITKINADIQDMVGVKYNTKRRKPHQSPSESMAIGMASCTGLSILLVDALRAVGIPARVAGTPLWINLTGNHNWVEVWIDGDWYVTEYNPGGLNQGWFLGQAGLADKNNPKHCIYASSWKPTGVTFPLVWDRERKTRVPAYDVSDFYINLRNSRGMQNPDGVAVQIRMFTDPGADKRTSASRVESNVSILDDKGGVVAVGTTSSATADMNNVLTISLPAKRKFTVMYTDAQGGKQSKEFSTNEPAELDLYYSAQ